MPLQFENPLLTGEFAYNHNDARRRGMKARIIRIWYSKFGEGRATLRYEDGTVVGGVELDGLSRNRPEQYIPKGMDPKDWESVVAHIAATVTSAVWLVGRGYQDLANEQRDEFIREWGLDAEHWNTKVDELIDWVQRKGETPAISIQQLQDVRI